MMVLWPIKGGDEKWVDHGFVLHMWLTRFVADETWGLRDRGGMQDDPKGFWPGQLKDGVSILR